MDFFNDFQDFDGVCRVHRDRCAAQEGVGGEPVERGMGPDRQEGACTIDPQDPPRVLGFETP